MSDLPAKLTPRQQRFAELMAQTLNAAESARQAGYSERSAAQLGHALMRMPQVQAAVRQLLEERSLGAAAVLCRLGEHALANMADFLSPGPDGQPVVDLAKSPEKLHLIRSIRFSRCGKAEIELVDQIRALELLARVHGLFEERHSISIGPAFKTYTFDPDQVIEQE
jgi:hypothetical protein